MLRVGINQVQLNILSRPVFSFNLFFVWGGNGIFIYLHGYVTFFILFRHPISARSLFVSQQQCAQSKSPSDDDDEPAPQPIKFSTSKASHRSWSVDRSLGSSYERPWWKVLPISVIGIGFLLWCLFRKESEIDKMLEAQLHEHFPDLASDEDKSVKPK